MQYTPWSISSTSEVPRSGDSLSAGCAAMLFTTVRMFLGLWGDSTGSVRTGDLGLWDSTGTVRTGDLGLWEDSTGSIRTDDPLDRDPEASALTGEGWGSCVGSARSGLPDAEALIMAPSRRPELRRRTMSLGDFRLMSCSLAPSSFLPSLLGAGSPGPAVEPL